MNLKYIKRRIDYDQGDFIPRIQSCVANVERLINGIYSINKTGEKPLIISIGAEKSFDEIQHPFMIT